MGTQLSRYGDLAAHPLYRLPFGGTISSERVAPSGCSRPLSAAAEPRAVGRACYQAGERAKIST